MTLFGPTFTRWANIIRNNPETWPVSLAVPFSCSLIAFYSLHFSKQLAWTQEMTDRNNLDMSKAMNVSYLKPNSSGHK
eukprot:Pgem_evm1s8960